MKTAPVRPSLLPLLATLGLVSACTDGPVAPTLAPEPHLYSAEYECIAEFTAGTLECGLISPAGATGARLDVMLYAAAAKAVNIGGGAYSGADKSNSDTMTYNIALLNLIPQAIGTKDGTTADTSRLVITGYQLTSPTPATAQLANADGTATFVDSLNGGAPLTYNNKEFKNYPELTAPGDTSSAKFFQFVFSPSVTAMRFTYRVWTRVQYQYGWITASPATVPVLEPGAATTLTGTVYNAFGTVLSDPITWSSSNMAVAAVNSSTGEVTAVAPGTATITATSTVNAQRIGTRTIIVDAAPEVTGTTPADGATSVASNSNIVITFSEPVMVSENSFLLECPVSYDQARGITVDDYGPSSTFTIDPDENLPAQTECTVTVQASMVSDADTNDGPDVMALDHVFSFTVGP